jgi:retron-type reverse transcriptase
VQKAVVLVTQPYLDPLFLEGSMGFRPKISRMHALAQAERTAVEWDLWVWLLEDIKNAFDNVPQQRLLDVARYYLPDKGIVGLAVS